MSHSPVPPPSPPPKSPSIHTAFSHSTTSLTTEHYHSPARPTHAQRGVRQQASIHLSRAASAMNLNTTAAIESGSARPPSLSFLTHDPATIPAPSSASSSSCSNPASATSRRSSVARRISGLTTRSFQSGMADAESSLHCADDAEELSPGFSEQRSYASGMAVRAPSPSGMGGAKPRSLKSATSTSSKSRKRASNSTIHRRSFQRKYGKWEWEVDMSPLLEGDFRRREEELELAALLGRATVLERMLTAGKRVSGTPVSSLKHLASRPSTKSTTSASRRSPSRRSASTPRRSLSISIRSVRRHLSRRLRRKPSSPGGAEEEDAFTEIESQSGFGSAPPVQVVLSEQERGWVVLLPEKSEEGLPPPVPEKDGMCLHSPTCLSSPTKSGHDDTHVEREVWLQSPHLGHRSPDHHQRQSVLSYISAGRWSASTQGRQRRRRWVLGVSVGCLIGVIVLTGVLAGLLSRRRD